MEMHVPKQTMLPSAEEIKQTEPKTRPLPIEPWVAAHLSRVWQAMKKNISDSIAVGTQAQHHIAQSEPASSHNHS